MNVVRLRRDIREVEAAKAPDMDFETLPLSVEAAESPAALQRDNAVPDGQPPRRRSRASGDKYAVPDGITSIEAVVQRCAIGVALTAAAFFGVWLLKS